MHTSSRVFITASMMVVAGAVAGNLWAAENPAVDEGEEETASVDAKTPSPAAAPARAPRAQAKDAAGSFWSQPAAPNHARQFGLSLLPGSGYRIIVPYKEEVMCGDTSGNASRRVCTYSVPFFLEVQPSFGIYARLDFISDLRFSLQKEPGTRNSHAFAFAPGFRFWLDQDVALKFYTTAQVVYDYVERIAVKSSDFAVRNANGLMYDPIKNLGLYLQLGWTMGLVRWFRMELDAGVGIQVRYP
jgi:hypothetical protein